MLWHAKMAAVNKTYIAQIAFSTSILSSPLVLVGWMLAFVPAVVLHNLSRSTLLQHKIPQQSFYSRPLPFWPPPTTYRHRSRTGIHHSLTVFKLPSDPQSCYWEAGLIRQTLTNEWLAYSVCACSTDKLAFKRPSERLSILYMCYFIYKLVWKWKLLPGGWVILALRDSLGREDTVKKEIAIPL